MWRNVLTRRGVFSLAIAAVLLSPGVALATWTTELEFNNTSPYSMWVTVYEKQHEFSTLKRKWGCVPPGKTVKWEPMNHTLALKVLGEVTQNPNCAQPTMCATDMWVSTSARRPGGPNGNIYMWSGTMVHVPAQKHCHWQPTKK